MGFATTYCFATFAVILMTHETIFPVKGQCTVHGCDNGDPLVSIVAEIQQLRVDLFDQLNKEVQNIHELLNASFQEIKSSVVTSLQAVDRRRSQEHEIYINQVQSIHELHNESYQEIKSQYGIVMTSIQAVDRRRSQEHYICINQVQSIYQLLNESFQAIKYQHNTVNMSLQAVDRCPQEHDIYSNQFQRIQETLNQSFQEIKSHLETAETSLHAVERRHLQEHNIYIKQGQSIHELLNESSQQLKSQHDTLNLSLQAVDRRLQEHDISIKNQSRNSWKLANDFFDPASEVMDCSDIKASGQTTSGVYVVCVGFNRICTSAFCDMDTANGASLVFQRRKDGSVNFNRTWAEYKQGFGNRNGEFWLGNEMLFLLTSKRNYKLRVDLEDFHGNKSFAEYSTFTISSSAENYTLTVSGYSGNAGNSLSYHNGSQFTTIDVGIYCARKFGGAWWHSGYCFRVNLNGIYRQRYESVPPAMGIHWYDWHNGYSYSLKATEMRLVPVA